MEQATGIKSSEQGSKIPEESKDKNVKILCLKFSNALSIIKESKGCIQASDLTFLGFSLKTQLYLSSTNISVSILKERKGNRNKRVALFNEFKYL